MYAYGRQRRRGAPAFDCPLQTIPQRRAYLSSERRRASGSTVPPRATIDAEGQTSSLGLTADPSRYNDHSIGLLVLSGNQREKPKCSFFHFRLYNSQPNPCHRCFSSLNHTKYPGPQRLYDSIRRCPSIKRRRTSCNRLRQASAIWNPFRGEICRSVGAAAVLKMRRSSSRSLMLRSSRYAIPSSSKYLTRCCAMNWSAWLRARSLSIRRWRSCQRRTKTPALIISR